MAYTPAVSAKADAAIDFLRRRAQDEYRAASGRHDSIAVGLVKRLGSADALAGLKAASANEALSRLAQAKDNFDQIVVYPDKTVRKRQPIYDMPENRYGRAHLYSPAKRVGGVVVDTAVFNCLVIWAFAGALYFSLYFDLLRRMLDYFSNVQKRRMKVRMEKFRV